MNIKTRIKNFFSRSKARNNGREIHPDEIFLDSRNLPDFDVHQFEGRLEHPLSKNAFRGFTIVAGIVAVLLFGKLFFLQVSEGRAYEVKSENNTLQDVPVFAERGVIYDRTHVPLAWNELDPGNDFAYRRYATTTGVANVVGYVKYPSKDKAGVYYNNVYTGKDGVEQSYNDVLVGANGSQITETDASGHVVSQSVIAPPQDGKPLTLSIDAEVSNEFYNAMQETAIEHGFSGGAGVIMDVHSGEILSMVSYPSYDQNVMTDGTDAAAVNGYLTNPAKPFLDRAISGLYIPGSIIKPYIAMGVLEENIIDPNKEILSVGEIKVPNEYDPSKFTIFHDWEAHGLIDMVQAIAQSSDEYFYTVGGGYNGQKGLGIDGIDTYVKKFGFGSTTGIDLDGEVAGTIPSPAWKQATFHEGWYLGDTYNSSIGQYGFQVTPLQAARAVAVYANDGTLVTPTVVMGNTNKLPDVKLPFAESHFQTVRDGMQLSAETGTGSGLNMPHLKVAAKTGTAQLGVSKTSVNSWVMGYFPLDNPKYSFAVLMEHGPNGNPIGATYVMRTLLDWMQIYTPQYTNG